MAKNKLISPSIEQIAAELARRSTNIFDLTEYLFDKQLAFVNDPARFKTAVTTRRAGKTVACAADLLNTAIEHMEVVCLYITLSRTNAKKLIWPELKRINRKFKLGVEFNESDLSAHLSNGSVIYLSGASDRTEIEKFRGLALKKVYLDESQSFPAYIEELIDEVLSPALMDHAGDLCLIGTPGPVPSGYFYKAANSPAWSHHVWSFFDNHHLPALRKGRTHADLLQEELDRTGLTTTSPKIQREWFGKWELDTNSLVYQFSPLLNVYKEVPKGRYVYVMGVDLGFNDSDAIAVIAWNQDSKITYLVHEDVQSKQDLSGLVSKIEHLRKQYDIAKIVVDTGGLGKKLTEEMIRRYKIPAQAAEKTRKFEYIELMNDVMRSGRLQVMPGSRFEQDCLQVEWDFDKSTPDRKVISSRFHSDICEAVLYAWRESYSFTHTPPKIKTKWGSPEWGKEQEDEMFERELEWMLEQEELKKNEFE